MIDWRASRGAGCIGGCWGMPRSPCAVVPLVSIDAPENVTDAERNAGFVATDTAGPRPRSLAVTANFSRSGSGADAAYWLWQGNLYHGNALQVLRDARQELAVNDGPNVWSTGLLERIKRRAESYNVALEVQYRAAIPAMPGEGGEVGRQWVALALWTTYGPSSAGGRGTINDLVLPASVRWPTVGGDAWPNPSGLVSVSVGFNPADLSPNPFTVGGSDIPIRPTPSRPARTSSSGLLWLGAGALALMAMGRRS